MTSEADIQPDPTDADRVEARVERVRARARAHGTKLGHARGALAMLSRFLRPGDLVYDLGANKGAVTAKLARSGADIICYEPDPFCCDLLRQKFADAPNVTIRAEAASDRAGRVTFYRHREFDGAGSHTQSGTIVAGQPKVDYAAGIEVAQIDFLAVLEEAIAERGQIAAIKMDIEGAELPILRGMLERGLFDHVRAVLVETHEKQFPALADETRALREAISARYAPSHVYLDWI